MTENPICYREARAWRRPQRWLSLLAYPCLLMLPALLARVATRGQDRYALERAESTAFLIAVFSLVFYVCVRSLLATVSLVTQERERGTFEALATTRTPAPEIVKASLWWALWPRLLELLCFGPLLLLLPGSTSAPRVGLLLLLTAPCALAYALLGLWLSSRYRRSAVAIAQGLLILTFNFFGLMIVEVVVDELGRMHGPWLSWMVDPWVAGAGLLFDGNRSWHWVLCPLFHLAVSWVLYRLALRRWGRPEVSAPSAGWASRRWLLPVLSEHPILYRELLRTSRASLGWFLVYPLLVLGPLIFLRAFFKPGHGVAEMALVLALGLHAAYLALRSIGGGCRAVALELEQRTWEPLQSTHLSGGQLLGGKLAAHLLPMLAPLALFGGLWGVYLPASKAAGMLAYSIMLALFLFSLALWLSLRSRSSALVGVQVTGVLAGLSFGPLCVDLVLHGSSMLAPLSPLYAMGTYLLNSQGPNWLLAAGPYGLALVVLLALTRRRLGR